jgi:predicted Rossmann-fold nucleotide-binding protein
MKNNKKTKKLKPAPRKGKNSLRPTAPKKETVRKFRPPNYLTRVGTALTLLFSSGMTMARKRLLAALFYESTTAMHKLANIPGRSVAFFGSARTAKSPQAAHWKRVTMKLAELVALAGYNIAQGDGPSIMEWAAEGARRAWRKLKKGCQSFGFTIVNEGLYEQKPNPASTHHIKFTELLARLFAFVQADAWVAMGSYGIGTLLEVLLILQLKQFGMLRNKPLILFGTKEWAPFIGLLEILEKRGSIDQSDLRLFTVTDSIDEALDVIKKQSPPQSTKRSRKAAA